MSCAVLLPCRSLRVGEVYLDYPYFHSLHSKKGCALSAGECGDPPLRPAERKKDRDRCPEERVDEREGSGTMCFLFCNCRLWKTSGIRLKVKRFIHEHAWDWLVHVSEIPLSVLDNLAGPLAMLLCVSSPEA